MQSPRVFVFTGLSSCLIRSFLIILLFVGSLSTVPTAVSTDRSPKDNATFVPYIFPETNARPFTTFKNNSESYDMRHASVTMAEAAVDSEDGSTSTQGNSAATNTSTEYTAPAVTTSSISIVTSPAASIDTSSISSVSTEPPLASTSISIISTTTITTTTVAATTPIMNETVTQNTMPSADAIEPQTDPAESVTAKGLTEDSNGMPTGIVALVTMITFAIIVVVGYVGLIVWRRYLEYRYGNRELLVNDLEFDTNDLRHFEL